MTFVGLVTEDGKKLILDYQSQFKTYYAQFAGYEVELEIRRRRSKRSVRQNAWLWSFLKPLADHLGYQVEELKLIGLMAVFGTKVVMGFTVPEKSHTSELNTQEFSELCEWFVQKAAEVDYLVLYPEEFRRSRKSSRRVS